MQWPASPLLFVYLCICADLCTVSCPYIQWTGIYWSGETRSKRCGASRKAPVVGILALLNNSATPPINSQLPYLQGFIAVRDTGMFDIANRLGIQIRRMKFISQTGTKLYTPAVHRHCTGLYSWRRLSETSEFLKICVHANSACC